MDPAHCKPLKSKLQAPVLEIQNRSMQLTYPTERSCKPRFWILTERHATFVSNESNKVINTRLWKSITEACDFDSQQNKQNCKPRLWKSITEACNLRIQQNNQSCKPRLWKSITESCNCDSKQNNQSRKPRLWKSKTEACKLGIQPATLSFVRVLTNVLIHKHFQPLPPRRWAAGARIPTRNLRDANSYTH